MYSTTSVTKKTDFLFTAEFKMTSQLLMNNTVGKTKKILNVIL